MALAVPFFLAPPAARAEAIAHHELQVRVTPDTAGIEVVDRLTLPAPTSSFSLNHALEVTSPDADLALIRQSGEYRYYRIKSRTSNLNATLRYKGALPLTAQDGSGIGADNIYLDWRDAWFPRFDSPLTFSMTVTLPEGWTSVSQGRRDGLTWTERGPQQEIYLLAAPFHVYQRATPRGEALVFLRQADDRLAETYLSATGRYLDLYSRLIGDYPYAKFALVENKSETGLGMPSFTLLGPRVIRLPFIPYTSYPHEVLHNWWGNSVYVDPTEGNWSEGLTSYLADHLFAEQEGRGDDYRLSALLKYADYVRTERDFPLRDFTARHGEVTQAVGYSKGLMFFHMLRLRLGDARFIEGLRLFYRDQRFKAARFSQLRAAMEAASGENLARYFDQWVTRTGAPVLRLSGVQTHKEGNGFRLRAVLEQTQAGAAYELQVPVAVTLEGHAQAREETVVMSDKRKHIDLRLPGRPVRIEVDPRSDVFRRLDPAERPPSLAQLFADERPLFVLPAGAPEALRQAYEALANQWIAKEGKGEVVRDRNIARLPERRAVWLLGWENRFRDAFARELAEGSMITDNGARLGGEEFASTGYSIVVAAKPRAGGIQALIATDSAQAVPGLTRKLPHYDKYGYLVFRGDAPDNIRKGQAKPSESPLIVKLGAGAQSSTPAPRQPLTAIIGYR